MHTPVLLNEAIEGLNIKRNGLYIDATVGEGGHLIEIAKRGGKVLGIDWDDVQIKSLKLKVNNEVSRHPEFISGSESKKQMLKRVQHDIKIVQGNFADIEKIAKENNFYPVDGVFFDLGLSMIQIKKSGRGFSYKNLDEPLDMRIDMTSDTTASELVNSLNQNDLYELFARYGEEINSLAISQAIVRARSLKKIDTVAGLIKIIDRTIGEKDNRTYARIFQSLRIAVNDEFENLKKGLAGAMRILKEHSRIVAITFHSLEDRIVKQFIRNNNLKQLNKKVIMSGDRLEFERSAKLRIIEV